MAAGRDTSLFIVPRESTAWRGNEAGWITASGWAAAGKSLWGEALVGTRDGVFTPEETRLFPQGKSAQKVTSPLWRKFTPEFMITAYKDFRLWQTIPRVWPIEESKWFKGKNVRLVWERHDLFHGPGRRIADRFGVPLVTSVEAVVVWEAQKWGVKRPGYGAMLERGEGTSLRRSDLVLCVSESVRQKVLSLGTDPARTLVTPNRVDSVLFHPGVSGESIRKQFKLEGKRVVGWTGSFRKFHGLRSVVSAFVQVHQQHSDTVLMLVGDGQELEFTRALAEELGLGSAVVFAGRQPFTSIPTFLAAFDVGLVTAASTADFHYSPLKLREYLAVGKAIIAPRVGDLPERFRDGSDLLFYEADNADHLAAAMLRVLGDSVLRQRLEARAAQLFMEDGTWVHELRRICAHLGIPTDDNAATVTLSHG